MVNVLKHEKVYSASEKGIRKAINVIRDGGVAILPADTVYGFFASAVCKDSVAKVYQIKNRPIRKPFVIYTNHKKVDEVVYLNNAARKFINHVWPKALSLILNKKPIIPDWFTNHGSTLSVMTAKNPVVSKVIAEVDEPILGTTCNLSGEPEIKKADEVIRFIDQVGILIADDTIPVYNKPSTMIDCTIHPPKIVRLSSLSLEELQLFMPALEIDLERRLS